MGCWSSGLPAPPGSLLTRAVCELSAVTRMLDAQALGLALAICHSGIIRVPFDGALLRA